MRFSRDAKPDTFEVIGVVADAKNQGVQDPPAPEVFLPHTLTGTGGRGVLVRTSIDPLALANSVRREVWAVDRNMPLSNVGTLHEVLQRFAYAEPRFSLIIVVVFAAVGLALVAIGVYSVLSYAVSRQTHEIGIRVALGADQSTVLWMVVTEGAKLVASGACIGLLGSFGATRLIERQLWNVSSHDPAVIIAAIAVIGLTALLASVVPAVRATRVDPMTALRSE